MLEVQHISKSFGGVKATDDVSLDFATGSLTAWQFSTICRSSD